jgi:hypothetical protein
MHECLKIRDVSNTTKNLALEKDQIHMSRKPTNNQKRSKNKTLYVDHGRNPRERAQQTAQRAVLIAETNLP